MNTQDVVLKEVGPVRVAELTATAASYGPEDIGPAIQPLYPALFRRLHAAGVSPNGPAIAYYEPDPGESVDAVTVHAAVPVAADPDPRYDFTVVDLPAIPAAATIVHHGSMDDVMRCLPVLAGWIEDNGYRPVVSSKAAPIGYVREVYLDYDPEKPDQGVTELQVAVVKD